MSLLDRILAELNRVQGIDLRGYRRSTLERRLAHRLAQIGEADEDAYIHRLQTDPDEPTRLIDSFAINASSFFRDPIVFEILAQSVLPGIIEAKRRRGSREIRAWSAGCAAGEEAYSVAILLHEVLGDELKEWNCLIFATDIDQRPLQAASDGIFPRESLEQIRLGLLDRYFTPEGNAYRLRHSVRKMVRFSRDDLTSPERTSPAESVFGTFDLVLCRNVLIYFNPDLQKKVLERLTSSLVVGGHLILGSSESIGAGIDSLLATVDGRNRLFHKLHPTKTVLKRFCRRSRSCRAPACGSRVSGRVSPPGFSSLP